eukprot:1038297-Lingulodinium_polyedra.AAC.1
MKLVAVVRNVGPCGAQWSVQECGLYNRFFCSLQCGQLWIMETTTCSSVESTVGPLMESTIVSFVESREGSIVASTTSLHWIAQGFPQWVHNGHYLLLVLIESTMECAIVSTMSSTEEFTVVHCRHRCANHCRLNVESTVETKAT